MLGDPVTIHDAIEDAFELLNSLDNDLCQYQTETEELDAYKLIVFAAKLILDDAKKYRGTTHEMFKVTDVYSFEGAYVGKLHGLPGGPRIFVTR